VPPKENSLTTTECTQVEFGFQPLKKRGIRAQFDDGAIASDGGGLLLREVEQRIRILRQFAACFTDYPDAGRLEHLLEEMVAQRVYGLALGYEDLNDHEELRNDPLLAVLVDKADPGKGALAGKSTLNLLELTEATATAKDRYKKIVLDHGALDGLLVDLFLQAHREAPKEIILDLDATDDPLRGDSGFCREELMAWCEAEQVEYLLGLAKNERLKAEIEKEMQEAKEQRQQTGSAARRFKGLVYRTRTSWCRARRVVAKAEHLDKGENPQFVVTSLPEQQWPAQALYEELYCARGEMENRIKEQLMLFSDRTSTHYLRSNRLRLYFSSIPYVLLQTLRRLGLEGTELPKAHCSTIWLKLLKISALIRISVRKVWVSLAGGYPYAELFRQIHAKLCAVPLKR
jgi:hypothetical protein